MAPLKAVFLLICLGDECRLDSAVWVNCAVNYHPSYLVWQGAPYDHSDTGLTTVHCMYRYSGAWRVILQCQQRTQMSRITSVCPFDPKLAWTLISGAPIFNSQGQKPRRRMAAHYKYVGIVFLVLLASRWLTKLSNHSVCM